jgi:prophage maintenance system killer protein
MTEQLELAPQNTIRIETALSRFPVHRLAKRGNISIEISERNNTGEVKTRWEVTHNSKYGQPGPLAYKVDTLIVNRRIDDARPTIQKLIRLGSLTEITQELGLSHHDTGKLKKALLQNVGALITAKINYKGNDGIDRSFEAAFTRYSAIFTGERFPDGSKADAVYLILNDVYMKVLNDAQTRPLDYNYLRELPPAPRRFYELLSFQMFATLRNERPRAKMLYSYYCTRAPQTRYFDYEHFKKQMYKVHAPHLKSGYLAKVEFQEQRAESGEPDWIMFYTPGHRAKAEFREATKPRAIQRPKQTRAALLPAKTEPEQPPPAQIVREAEPQELDSLVTKLTSFHIAEVTASELVRDYRKSVELQLRALPYRNLNKIKDLAAWLIVAIKESHQLPEAITEAQAKEEEVRKAQAKREAHDARQRDEEARRAAYFDFLRARAGQTEKKQPEAYRAFLADTAAKRAELEADPMSKGQAKKILLRVYDDEQSQLERFRDYFNEPNLEEWQSRQLEP